MLRNVVGRKGGTLSEEKVLPFIEHLVELRKRLMIVVVAVVIGIYNGLIGHIDKHDPAHLLLDRAEDTSMVWDAV